MRRQESGFRGSRRQILRLAGAAGVFAALRPVLGAAQPGRIQATVDPTAAGPFGALVPDPQGVLDLPRGFSYRIISRAGAVMSDGLLVPGSHDGMAAFDAGGGRLALVCNHELSLDEQASGPFGPDLTRLAGFDRSKLYEPADGTPAPGGTTTVIYDPATGRVERHFLSLAGTERNCCGGPTPWGSWLTCEESVERRSGRRTRDHGWVFEVPAGATGPVDPLPLTALGRFNHEAAAVDPRTGVVYLTEDEGDSLFYRLIPARPGDLKAGGRLQALVLSDWEGSADTRNWDPLAAPLRAGDALRAEWIDLTDTDSPQGDLRSRGAAAGAARFARGEGIWFGGGDVYFACTSGGAIHAGQIFRYRPSAAEGSRAETTAPGHLELFVESTDRRSLDMGDNLTMAPWGDLLVCEDADSACSLVGVTPDAQLYRFAENAYDDSELAGACFAPDGHTLFVNLQARGLTLAIEKPPRSASSPPAPGCLRR